MKTVHKVKKPRRGRRGLLRGLLFVLLLGMGAAVAAAWAAYDRLGRTPAELLDYVDRRLEGHGKLEWAARPVIAGLRSSLDAPSVAERRQAFVVPPPPPRRGVDAVAAPEPDPPGAKVWRVGPGELLRVADAARQARDGDVVEIVAGDYRGDMAIAVWRQKKLTIRGVGGAARLFADGRNAEGKAIWVIRDGDFDISNIDFVGTRASDGNGAGIRFEKGHLRLRHCLFWDNQMGLLTGDNLAHEAKLEVESSEFAYSLVRGRWGHNLYAGRIASLTVTGSYFHHAGVGHLLKSRARRTELRYNRFTDEDGGSASYELNFPNGGEVILVGNIIQQQPRTENGKMISFGEEGYDWPVSTLQMASNTLVNDLRHGGMFLYVAPGAQSVLSANNLRVGQGRDDVRDPLTTVNDHRAEWKDFAQPARLDYRLRQPPEDWRYQPLNGEAGGALTPRAIYVHPMTVQPLPGAPAFVGADPRAP